MVGETTSKRRSQYQKAYTRGKEKTNRHKIKKSETLAAT
jgi:hypothetical protein